MNDEDDYPEANDVMGGELGTGMKASLDDLDADA